MSEGETAVDKDTLAELDREASDYLKVRLCPTSSHYSPLFCFFPSFSGEGEGREIMEEVQGDKNDNDNERPPTNALTRY